MGPNVVFDKSFLQILTTNEAALFDNYFTTTIVPTFYMEVLGDLAKEDGKLPEKVVMALANKTPRQHSYPTAYFRDLVAAEIAGARIDMSMRPHVMGGHGALANGKLSIEFKQTPEHIAFDRWQRGDFQGVERAFAKQWRSAVASIDLNELAKSVKSVKDLIGEAGTQDQARKAAADFVDAPLRQAGILKHIVQTAGLGAGTYARVMARWEKAGRPPIKQFLPYGSFVLEIDIFFEIAVMKSFVSTRPSNQVDLTYMYYLPFSHVFVSRDKLHRRIVPLFLTGSQRFIWGDDLKSDLAILHTTLSQLPVEVLEKGLMKFAKTPPVDHVGLVSELWDWFNPSWRNKEEPKITPQAEAKLLAEFRRLAQAHAAAPLAAPNQYAGREPEYVRFERSLPRRIGDYYTVPKDYQEGG